MMRTVHRILATFAVTVLLYLGVTGSLMQSLDLAEIISGAPERAPGMQSINEGKNGNLEYAVVTVGDYDAAPLPKDLDVPQALHTVLEGLHREIPGAHPTFVELRVANGSTIGQARFGPINPRHFADGIRAVDARTGAAVAAVDVVPMVPALSARETLKHWHRFWNRRDVPGVYVELLCGTILWVLLVTGLTMYFRMLKQRRKIRRPQLFWKGGGRWRELHRIIAVAAAILLIAVAFSGTWLGFESTWHTFQGGAPSARVAELGDAEVMEMADATLRALHAFDPRVAVKVLRMRSYAGMSQGVVVTDDPVTRQLVFNTATGKPVGLSEPGYPPSGFPLGVATHEWVKHFHSGFLFGPWARVLDLLAGLSAIFLAVSGLTMYLDMYGRRRRSGRKALFWK